MRIGILGGTFDPMTEAHEAIVKKVLDDGVVDKVVVMPSVVEYHRVGVEPWLTLNERRSVLENRVGNLLSAGYNVTCDFSEYSVPECIGDEHAHDYRIGRRFYHMLVPWLSSEDSVHVIIGVDQYNKFKTWFMWDEILKRAGLIVVEGRGIKVDVSLGIPARFVQISDRYDDVSATSVRRRYRGTPNALERYIGRLQPAPEDILVKRTPIFDLVEKYEVKKGFRPVGIVAPDWVMAVARHNGRYLMVRQTRYGTMKKYDEFVCGQVEKGENPVQAACRELCEETGLRSFAAPVNLGSYDTNPAFMSNKIHLFLFELDDWAVNGMKEQTLDEHESIEVVWMDEEEVVNGCGAMPAYKALAIAKVDAYDRISGKDR